MGPGLLVAVHGPEVRGHPERLGGSLQGAGYRLGADHRLHGLMRDLAGPVAGDPGFKVLTSSDPAKKTRKLSAEIANGRLAMMAIIGMFFQDGLTGNAWGDWALYTDSPLRAFESELGVQAPLGFWDPMGFTKDGDQSKFHRRRLTE